MRQIQKISPKRIVNRLFLRADFSEDGRKTPKIQHYKPKTQVIYHDSEYVTIIGPTDSLNFSNSDLQIKKIRFLEKSYYSSELGIFLSSLENDLGISQNTQLQTIECRAVSGIDHLLNQAYLPSITNMEFNENTDHQFSSSLTRISFINFHR